MAPPWLVNFTEMNSLASVTKSGAASAAAGEAVSVASAGDEAGPAGGASFVARGLPEVPEDWTGGRTGCCGAYLLPMTKATPAATRSSTPITVFFLSMKKGDQVTETLVQTGRARG